MDELFSIEVFVRKVYSIDVECHLPSLSFRLLDFPAQTIYITSPERIAKIQSKIAECPDYLTELEKLRNSNGDIVFNKGKSCLFPLSFESAQSQLSEIPLFLVLTDDVTKKPRYVGSIGISLAKLMNSLREKTSSEPTTICNDALRGSYPIKNLMGTRVAKLAVEVKLFYYGKNLVHHIPALTKVAEKSHDSTLGVSSHLKSEEDVISMMEDIRSASPAPPLHDSTPEIATPESVDSEKERDETDLNPPPLFYQAPLNKDDVFVENKPSPSRDTNKSTKSHQKVASPQRCSSRLDHQVPSDIMSPVGPVMSPVNRRSSDVDLQSRGYDPKKFDLIRAVLTELTYLTDFLDPNLVPTGAEPSGGPSNNQLVNELRKPTAPKKPKVKKPHKPRVLGIGKYGLTNSYILRLSRLGPDKASEVLSKHLDKQSVCSIMEKLFSSTPSTTRKRVEPVKKPAKPTLVSTESQTDTLPAPRVAWQDQSPVFSPNRRIDSSTYSPDNFNRLSGTAPFTVIQGGQTLTANHLQSTNSSTMAQVLAAMQALANTGHVSLDGDTRVTSPTRQGVSPIRDTLSHDTRAGSSARKFSGSPHKDYQERDAQSRLSRHSSLRRASSMQEYNYSDNFEEPSCVSLNTVSPGAGRPRSRAATHSRLSMRDLVVEEDAPESGGTGATTLSRRSSRNTRYEKRSNSLKTRTEGDSSSTTSTAGSTTYVSPRRFRDSTCSRKSQTSPESDSTAAAAAILQRSNSVNSAVSIACQTPALSRTHSTQTQAVSESDESVMTVLPSPTRDMPPSPAAAEVPSDDACATARHDGATSAISSHSSLESGSIYIGSDTEGEEGEEDPLQLSYLLSTESVQFSDEDQPTSLLKLCSPSEARAVNKFMYTF